MDCKYQSGYLMGSNSQCDATIHPLLHPSSKTQSERVQLTFKREIL